MSFSTNVVVFICLVAFYARQCRSSDVVIYDINTQFIDIKIFDTNLVEFMRVSSSGDYPAFFQPAKCTEVVSRAAQNDCRWVAGLNSFADQVIEDGRIIAYKIRWFNGSWSGWFVPGVNDLDRKFNIYSKTCDFDYGAKTMRRYWAYFTDHVHTFIICKFD